jgi:hypothetical protein
MPDAQLKALAEEVSQKTVEKTFLMVGADVTTPEGVAALQKDFAFSRRHRQAHEQAGRTVRRVAIATMVATSITGAFLVVRDYLWIAVRDSLLK